MNAERDSLWQFRDLRAGAGSRPASPVAPDGPRTTAQVAMEALRFTPLCPTPWWVKS